MTTDTKGMSRAALVKALESAETKGNGAPRKLSMKVGAKGGISIYGLNARFPVTLYAEQWPRLLDFGPQILEFIDSKPEGLAVKEA